MTTSFKLPAHSAQDYENLGAALAVLALAVPARTTIRQALFLAIVCYASAMGRSITLKDVVDAAGDGNEHDERGAPMPLLGRAIEKSSAVFFEPHKRNPDGLGWIEQVPNEDDRRQKFLRLTPLGAEACGKIIQALRAH
jgi:hypothetical protein